MTSPDVPCHLVTIFIIRMKFHKNKFLTTIAAVALALAVGACSSNGDDAEMSDMDMAPPATTDPAPELTAAEQLTAAETAVAAAKVMVAALTDSSTAEDAAAAYTALGEAQAALHTASSLPENQIAAKQAEIDALQAQVDQLTLDLAEATKEPDPLTEAEMTATTAAGTKEMAIGMEAAQTTVDGPGGLDAGTDHAITIARARDGTTVTIAVGGAVDDDPEFAQAMDFGDGRTMHVRAMEANDDGEVVEEVVIVSTDIEAPTATAFATIYPLDANPNDATTPVNQSLGIDAENLAMIATTGITATGAGQITVLAAMEDNAGTADEDETVAAFETDATFDGADGTLRCDGATDCTVTLDADGEITAFGDGWIFTPDADVTVDVADNDGFLSYGFWLERTRDANGVVTSYGEVETFAEVDFIPATGNAGLNVVAGSATYVGGSVGVYVKNVLDDQANIVSATSGHFSADVELTASFGGGGVAANDQFTIGGTITDFVLSGGEDNDWGVGLGLADFSGRDEGMAAGESPPGSNFAGVFNGVATGDSTAVAGSWNGIFHGSSEAVDHDMDNATPEINPQPVAVIGEFNANFTDGTTAGAYGANRQ